MASQQPIGVVLWNKFILFLVKRLPEPWLSQQARKPSGLLGRWIMTRLFKNGNAELNFFMLQLLQVQKTDHVLEVGFGPGFLISRLAQFAQEGRVEGLDFSTDMYNQAFFYNRGLIRLGVVNLTLGNSSDMPYKDEQFDKICTANTLYFWQPPEVHLAEVFRVLKPGGQFVLGFRDKEQMDQRFCPLFLCKKFYVDRRKYHEAHQ